MEQVEQDRNQVFDLARPIIEDYKKFTDHGAVLERHLESLKVLGETSSEVDDVVLDPPKKLQPVMVDHIASMGDLLLGFKNENDGLLAACDKLRRRHNEAYKTYGDCLRKLDRFNITVQKKEEDEKPVSNSESQRVVLIVTRMQEAKAALDLISTECHEQLAELKSKQDKNYDNLKNGFRGMREKLFRRAAEHLHTDLRS